MGSKKEKQAEFIITLEEVDELYGILIDIEMVTYLQGLMNEDIRLKIYDGKLDFGRKTAKEFLFDMQLETVTRLGCLINNQEFAKTKK